MPELPEVEAARRAIEENCIGKKIVKAIIANDQKVIDSVSPSDFESSLLHKTIVSARRKGKNLWLVLDSPPFPSFQFGMAGAIYIKGVAVTKYKRSAVKDTDEWPSKYSKLFIELDDGMEVSFTDKRRFSKVRLLKDPALVPPISELGPDALLELMPVDDFYQSLSKKKVSIKTLLLDQGFMSGIGNWIADEVLYQARLHPQQIASSLSKESCETLLKCIKEVTEKAIEVGADSSQFPSNWLFHSREKKPGKAFVDGKTIGFITAGGRTTAYVPELQKLSGDQIAKAAGKPRKQAPKRKKGGDEDNDSDNGDEDAAAVDEPSSEEGDTSKKADSKREVKPRGRGKKPPPKRKSQPSDSDNGDEDAAAADEASNEEGDTGKKADSKREVKPRGRGKKPPPKRKSQPSDSDNEDNDDNVDADDDNVQTKKAGRVETNKKQTKAAAAPKKKAASRKK